MAAMIGYILERLEDINDDYVGSRKIFRKKVFNTAPRLSKRHTECLPIK